MATLESKKLALENSSLKRKLQQRDKTISSIQNKLCELKLANKLITSKLERSKKKTQALKTALSDEQKKTFDNS
jgi:predicted RNase H-like nuclease (RuvC/YqgF family)